MSDNIWSVFDNAADLLRSEGLDMGMESLCEFSRILFVRMLDDDTAWRALQNAPNEDLLDIYKQTLSDLCKQFKFDEVFQETKLAKHTVLRGILVELDSIDQKSNNKDVKSEAYQYFLRRYNGKGKTELGQHFTPMHIIKFLVKLLKPMRLDCIYDPFCGTASMLVECLKYIPSALKDVGQACDTQNISLRGKEINRQTAILANMNMLLAGQAPGTIERVDSLSSEAEGIADVIVTNIPFNVKANDKSLREDPNVMCVKHCLRALKPGGRMAIIVPDSLMYQEKYQSVRRYLLDICSIQAVIWLPRHTFKFYTTARAAVLYATDVHKGKTSEFAFIELKHDGFSDSKRRERIKDDDIPKVLDSVEAWSKVYPVHVPCEHDAWGFIMKQQNSRKDGIMLRDLVTVKTKSLLDPEKEYSEPRLDSVFNTIRQKGNKRLGKNIKAKKKVLIQKGDLVIATLHTQQGNGLFAISDSDYIATSQIVCQIKDELISADYLVLALRAILPTLKTADLVGRETYKKDDLLDIQIPALSASNEQKFKQYKQLKDQVHGLESQIHEIENQIIQDVL